MAQETTRTLADLQETETSLAEALDEAKANVGRCEEEVTAARVELDHAEADVTQIEQRLGLTRDLIEELENQLEEESGG